MQHTALFLHTVTDFIAASIAMILSKTTSEFLLSAPLGVISAYRNAELSNRDMIGCWVYDQ